MQTVALLQHVKEQGLSDHTSHLIVCPLSVLDNAWVKELRNSAPRLNVVRIYGEDRKEQLAAAKRSERRNAVGSASNVICYYL